MDIKWFFVIIGIFLTFAILTGMYFVTNFALLQQQKYYEVNQFQSSDRFNKSQTNHDNQTNTITREISHLNGRLDPILDQVPNATQSKLDQELHYNQTTEDFAKIQQVLQIKLLDHITLIQVNKTVNQIADFLFNQTTNTGNGSIIIDNTTKPLPSPTPLPVPAPIIINNDTGKKDNNETGGIIIENITSKNG
jgi:TolA-binding protein